MFLNLECKLTSCDLKYKRSLLPQIGVQETLAKLVSAWGSMGTPARQGWRPLCLLVPEDGSALSFVKAVYSGHHVPQAMTSSPSPVSPLLGSPTSLRPPGHVLLEAGRPPLRVPGRDHTTLVFLTFQIFVLSSTRSALFPQAVLEVCTRHSTLEHIPLLTVLFSEQLPWERLSGLPRPCGGL